MIAGVRYSTAMIRTPLRHLRPEDLAGLRWRGLVRESTARQSERWSPERQRADIARAAEALGLVPAPDPLYYERIGSGEAIDVPELDRAYADALAGQYDVLVVLTTSRFARNRAEAVRRKAEFARAGVPIYFVEERVVSGSRDGRLLEGIREVIDEHENEIRRSWIAGGLRERQRAGCWVGRVPFGYRREVVVRDGVPLVTGRIVPDETEAPIVRELFRRAAAGQSLRELAAWLNARGVATRCNGPWTSGTISRLLRNPIYVGQLVRYRRPHDGHYYPEHGPDGRAVVASVEPLVPATDAGRLS